MASIDEVKDALRDVLTNTRYGNGNRSLFDLGNQTLSELRTIPQATVQTLLTTKIARAGEGKAMAGSTSLGAVLAYVDDYVIRILGGQEVGGTIDAEAVRAAVKEAADAALSDVEITLTTKG